MGPIFDLDQAIKPESQQLVNTSSRACRLKFIAWTVIISDISRADKAPLLILKGKM